MTADLTEAAMQRPDSPAQQEPGKRRTWKAGRKMEGRSLRILEMAGRADGVTNRDVQQTFDVCDKKSGAMLGQLALDGHLHRGKVPRVVTHYFTTPAAARAWEARQIAPGWRLDLPSTPVNLPRPDRVKAAAAKAPRAVVMHGDVKITRGPSITFDPRYQVDPATRVFGGFATLGIGKYLA